MASQTRFKVNAPTVTHETIEGESVIINLKSGNYYSLQGTGALIWDLVIRNLTVDDIVATLCPRYDSPRAQIEEGALQLLSELEREQLIVADLVTTTEARGVELSFAAPGDTTHFQIPELQKFTDMQELLLLDPIHEVDAAGWPSTNRVL